LTLDAHFKALTGFAPFRWQRRLMDAFAAGDVPAALDIPTGLGKTAAMAAWLVARAGGAPLPRRLVYVVDRRAVVDQATGEAERLREALEGPAAGHLKEGLGMTPAEKLAISTLRGRFVDNRDWLEDPSAPAIIVGTVDMIGSRLLFAGYGVSRRMRPVHAGLLGVDALVLLDEAHLVPPFERLLESAAADPSLRGSSARYVAPPLKMLPLSATGRARDRALGLTSEDFGDAPVRQRLEAPKRLRFVEAEGKLWDALAAEAWALAAGGDAPARAVVYCDSRDVAEKTASALEGLAKGSRKEKRAPADAAAVELLTGARRVRERDAVRRWLEEEGFAGAAADAPATRPAILVATSAGEVGVDFDADHLVGDVVEWERMVQRLGRVNRRGAKAATRIVLIDGSAEEKDEARRARKAAARALLAVLPEIAPESPDGERQAGPAALRALAEAEPDAVRAASTPEPLRPALGRAVLEAWAMTSLADHPGRPDVAPWLRGWVADDAPQTRIVWRRWMPFRDAKDASSDAEIETFFAAAPPHLSETLETESRRVADWLIRRASAPSKVAERPGRTTEVAVVLEADGSLARSRRGERALRFTLKRLAGEDARLAGEYAKRLEPDLRGRTLVVDARFGGLSRGLLDVLHDAQVTTADDKDGDDPEWSAVVGFNIAHEAADEASGALDDRSAGGRKRADHRFALERDAEGAPVRWLIVRGARTEDARSVTSGPEQTLAEHEAWTEREARRIAARLNLPSGMAEAIALAARLHDEGKKADRWQRAFGAPRGGEPYAKTRSLVAPGLLDGYRHEFGSLFEVEGRAELSTLCDDDRALALHLIAAHHGNARPLIETHGCDAGPPSRMRARAREVALRYCALQDRYGPWGLAWLEGIVRAADRRASQMNDERSDETERRDG